MQLDLDFIRSQFPAFSEPSLADQSFFENAGGSFACRQVIDRLSRFYRERKVQPYGPYDASRLGGEEMDEARNRLASMLGVEVDELSFGPSTTQNVYVLAQAFRQILRKGDEIVVTDQDHEANSGPWRRLADDGIKVREWRLDRDTGHLDLATLLNILNDRTRLVCFPHCSNVVGEVNDVVSICRAVREAGGVTCVDGVSFAPHGLPDVGALGADVYLFSAYKTFGPHQGVMAVRRELGMRLPNQGHFFNGDSLFKRFTPAGPDHAQVAASAGIADYFDALHSHHLASESDPRQRTIQVRDLIQDHETKLLRPLLEFLSDRNRLRLLGPRRAERRAPTVAVDCGASCMDIAVKLAARGILAGSGDFYAVRPLRAMGVDPEQGVLRLSFVHYTSEGDIERLMCSLDQVI